MSTLQRPLEEHPFLKDMPSSAVALLSGCAKNVRFGPGEALTRTGSHADTWYLVRSGRVTVSADGPTGPLIVNTAGPGDLVGWSWIVSPYRYRFDATATEPTLAFGFEGKCLRDKCEAHPELGYQLLKRVTIALGMRLDELQLRLLDVYRGPENA